MRFVVAAAAAALTHAYGWPGRFFSQVNPFLPTTDPGLFDWAKDKKTLEGAAGAAFEFRLRTEAPRGAMAGAARLLACLLACVALLLLRDCFATAL